MRLRDKAQGGKLSQKILEERVRAIFALLPHRVPQAVVRATAKDIAECIHEAREGNVAPLLADVYTTTQWIIAQKNDHACDVLSSFLKYLLFLCPWLRGDLIGTLDAIDESLKTRLL